MRPYKDHAVLDLYPVPSDAEVRIYGMTVNHFADPIGIDTAAPTFCWKLQSDTVGQKQTAYQLVIAVDQALSRVVWDSGRVQSDVTADITYSGDPLADCTRYYWQVTVWDMQGSPFTSDIRFFETAFINGSLTDGADWIALRERWEAEDGAAIHYTFEADLSLQSKAAALCFAMKDTEHFAMWQLAESNGRLLFRPQVRSDGTFQTLAELDISDKLSLKTLQTGAHLKIEVRTDIVDLYANGLLVNRFNTTAIPADLSPRKFGTCIAADERFTLDNLKAVDYTDDPAGKVLFDHDCEHFNPLYRGQLKDGKIRMTSKTDMGVTMVHNGTATFRKAFEVLGKPIASARLYITSYGLFSAYLNGNRVGNKNADGEVRYEELTPGWTDPHYRTCYCTYDVTDLLEKGENTLAVSVNDGWTGVVLYNVNEPPRPHRLLAKAVITYTDGTTAQIGTDSTWKSARMGPVISATIFQGEFYDANADTSYRLNGYDDTAWTPAEKVPFDTTLTSRIGGQIYLRKDLERIPRSVTVYRGVTDVADGVQYGKINTVATYGDESFPLKAGEIAVVDFGQNAAGWENITLTGAKGTEVVIRHAEMLNDHMGLISRGNDGPEGSVYTANLRNAPARTLYVMRDGAQCYRPSATYYGFRYVEITASADITVTRIRGEVASSVTEETSSFESSSALLNQLHRNILWGQRSNYFGQATDCPQRDERLGYSGDAQVFSQTAMYNADVKAFMYNFMDTLTEGQSDDGAYGTTMPRKKPPNNPWVGVAGFADAGIIVPLTYYKQYGDIAFLERYYPSMEKYMDYLAACGAERIGQKFGDWLAYEDKIINYISYVYTVWDAQMMQEIAQILGKTEDVAKWEVMERLHRRYFRDKFLDDKGDLVRDVTTQTGYLFALKLGLYETPEAWQRGKALLIEKIRSNGNRLSTGFMGTSIMMETLVEIGEKELAYELLFQDQNPSWLFSVKQGATTVWERWNSYSFADGFGPVSMNSFNHYAYGSVGAFLYNTVLGIRAGSAGYKSVLLAPETTKKLTYAKGSYDSANGKIESAWKSDGNGRYVYTFTVPTNTTATVRLEKQPSAGSYTVNGVAATAVTMKENGAQYLKEENGYLYFGVTSGTFVFACVATPTRTSDIAALEKAGTVLRNGRTAFSGTDLLTNFANSGITLSGYLYGDITVSMSAATSKRYTPGKVLYYNAVIDGNIKNATLIKIKNGKDAYTIAKDLRRGYHTVEFTRGTASNYGPAILHEITYTGTLQPVVRKALKMEFVGDSITNAEGTVVRNDLADHYYVERHNALHSYAAQVARALNAELSVVASSGISAQKMLSKFKKHPATEAKDLVVINLGTNDMGWSRFDLNEMEADGRLDAIRASSASLIDLVRSTYGEDVKIIWAYGMMYKQGMAVLQEVVTTYNAEHPGADVLFCNMHSVADTAGFQTHPSRQGHDNAAAYLSQFIRENCADILTSNRKAE